MSYRNTKMITVNGFSAKVTTRSEGYGAKISGEVYPFTDTFHSVKFEAFAENTGYNNEKKIETDFGIGFGGNEFRGIQAIRIASASQVAIALATEFGERMAAMNEPRHALSILGDKLHDADFTGLVDHLAICVAGGMDIPSRNQARTLLQSYLAHSALTKLLVSYSVTDDEFAAFVDASLRFADKKAGNICEDRQEEVTRRVAALDALKRTILESAAQ